MSQSRVMATAAANLTAPAAAVPLLHSLPEWNRFTRYGIPQFRVVRRNLTYNGTTLLVGATLPTAFMTLQRTRQFYEQRLIAPIAETIVKAPPVGRPASEAIIPPQVLEQQALDAAASTGMVETTFIDDLPGVDALLEEDVSEQDSDPAPVLPVHANKTNKANKR